MSLEEHEYVQSTVCILIRYLNVQYDIFYSDLLNMMLLKKKRHMVIMVIMVIHDLDNIIHEQISQNPKCHHYKT